MIPAEDADGIDDVIQLTQLHALQLAVQRLEIRLDLGIVLAVVVAGCFVQEFWNDMVKQLIQPVVIHDLFKLAEQMILGNQSVQSDDNRLSPALFVHCSIKTPLISSIIHEMGVLGKLFDKLRGNPLHQWVPRVSPGSSCRGDHWSSADFAKTKSIAVRRKARRSSISIVIPPFRMCKNSSP